MEADLGGLSPRSAEAEKDTVDVSEAGQGEQLAKVLGGGRAGTPRVSRNSHSVPVCISRCGSSTSTRLHTRVADYDRSEVRVHLYNCDPYTGFLNKAFLKSQELAIFHAGVEVYGEEWCFQYFEDSWDDPSVSGVMRCRPKNMQDYDYQESISLGRTPHSEEEVDKIVWGLHAEWPACSYHLTHQNCITFAETVCKKLCAPEAFPLWIKGIVDASNSRRTVDAMVDYSWSWMKWWMLRKHAQPDVPPPTTSKEVDGGITFGSIVSVDGLEDAIELNGEEGTCIEFHRQTDRWTLKLSNGNFVSVPQQCLCRKVTPPSGSPPYWSLFFNPVASCTEGAICPAGRSDAAPRPSPPHFSLRADSPVQLAS